MDRSDFLREVRAKIIERRNIGRDQLYPWMWPPEHDSWMLDLYTALEVLGVIGSARRTLDAEFIPFVFAEPAALALVEGCDGQTAVCRRSDLEDCGLGGAEPPITDLIGRKPIMWSSGYDGPDGLVHPLGESERGRLLAGLAQFLPFVGEGAPLGMRDAKNLLTAIEGLGFTVARRAA